MEKMIWTKRFEESRYGLRLHANGLCSVYEQNGHQRHARRIFDVAIAIGADGKLRVEGFGEDIDSNSDILPLNTIRRELLVLYFRKQMELRASSAVMQRWQMKLDELFTAVKQSI